MENKELIGQIRQRLEILYQMFEELEQGGGSPTDAYTKAETNALLAAKANKSETYTKTETNAEIQGAITDLDVASTSQSGHYIDYIAQEDGLIVPHAELAATSVIPSSEKLITSAAVYTALNPNTYVVPELHDHNNTKITIESGGYTQIGKLVFLNVRINTSAALTQTGIFTNLPNPLSDNELDMGSGVVSVSNNINATFYITNNGNLTMKAGTSVPSGTMLCLSCAYICK